MYTEKISEFLKDHKEEMTEKLSRLMTIPSIRGVEKPGMPYGEAPFCALKCINDMADEMGLMRENFENRISIVSANDNKKKLGILCHLDVVDVTADNWTTPPFEPSVKGNMIYGRGAYDNKGPAISALYALYAIKELKIQLKSGVGVYFGTDEECGSSDFEEYMKKHTMPECVFTPDSHFPVCTSESGLIRMSAHTELKTQKVISAHAGTQANVIPDEAIVRIKDITKEDIEKSLSELCGIKYDITEKDGVFEVKIHGRSVHASRPQDGTNAATALLKLLADVEEGVFGELSQRFAFDACCGEGFGFSEGQLTLALTVLDYENGRMEIQIDSRVSVGESSALAAGIIGENIPLESNPTILYEPHSVSEESYMVKTLMEIYREHTERDDKPYTMAGLTYAHNIPNAVAFGAKLDGDGSKNAHGDDECFNLDTMIKAAEMFAAAIIKICNE